MSSHILVGENGTSTVGMKFTSEDMAVPVTNYNNNGVGVWSYNRLPASMTSQVSLPDGDNYAITDGKLRQQKIQRQKQLLEQKQRAKRQTPTIIQANDARPQSALARKNLKSQREEARPLMTGYSQQNLHASISSHVINRTVTCLGAAAASSCSSSVSLRARYGNVTVVSSCKATVDSQLGYDGPLQYSMTGGNPDAMPAVQVTPAIDTSTTVFEDEEILPPSDNKTSETERKLQQLNLSSRIEFDVEEVYTRHQFQQPSQGQAPSLDTTTELGQGDGLSPPNSDEAQHNNIHSGSTESMTSKASGEPDGHNNIAMELLDDLDSFVLAPVPENVLLKCRITRDRKGMDRGFFPTYYLHMEKEDGRKIFLLAARKRKKSFISNYLISTDPTDLSRGGDSFVGKVRSNLLGTHFTIYNNGTNPKKMMSSGLTTSHDNTNARQELASIVYDTNVLGFKGPRKMTIIMPDVSPTSGRYIITPVSENDGLIERWKCNAMENLTSFHNKAPQWNDDTQSYVLNFGGRVTHASVKNFQVVNDTNTENIIMQFGRVADDSFTMDFRYPMCAVQAFGIALSSFDGKLACE